MHEQWRALLPTAYLLTGSDAAAGELLTRGLAAAGRLQGSGDRTSALAGLVRAHLTRWRVRGDGSVRGASAGSAPAAWWSPPAEAAAAAALAAALHRLDRCQRTAVVLRWHEGLPPDQVDALVPGTDLAAVAARLAHEVPDPADLPARLDGLAAQCDTSGLTDQTVALGVAAVRSARQRRVGTAVLAALAVGVGAMVLPGAFPAGLATVPTPEAADPLIAGPVRGSLAGDGALLTDALAAVDVPGTVLGTDPPPARVVFAGDLGGARAVLLVQQDAGGVVTTWFTGPAGTGVDRLQRITTTSDRVPAASAVALPAGLPGEPTQLLVVASDGDQVQVSPGVDIGPDGTAARTFDPVGAPDGVAVAEVRADPRAARFQVVRDGAVLVTGVPRGADRTTATDDAAADTTGAPVPARSGSVGGSPGGLARALDTVTAGTGWAPGDLTVSVLGAGSFPLAGGATAQSVTVAAALPGGGLVTTTAWVSTGSRPQRAGACGSAAYPAGTDPASLTVVARCGSYAADSSTFGTTVLVAAPPDIPVRLGTAAGGTQVTPDLVGGWGYVITDAEQLTEFATDGVTGTVSREGADVFSR